MNRFSAKESSVSERAFLKPRLPFSTLGDLPGMRKVESISRAGPGADPHVERNRAGQAIEISEVEKWPRNDPDDLFSVRKQTFFRGSEHAF